VIRVVVAELVLLAVMWSAFLVVHARWPWRDTPVGRQLTAMAVVSLGEAVSLALLAAGRPPPLWLFAVGFGAADAVLASWLVLTWRARRRAAEVEGR
jgi:hypothetical protein